MTEFQLQIFQRQIKEHKNLRAHFSERFNHYAHLPGKENEQRTKEYQESCEAHAAIALILQAHTEAFTTEKTSQP